MKKIVFFLAGLCLASCSSKPESSSGEGLKPTVTSVEAQQVANEQQATYVAELKFAKNSAKLSADSKSRIQHIVGQAEQSGKIKEVKVITWADQEYPSVHTKKLSAADRRLVQDRNKTIENFFGTMPGSISVTSYSMAERPNVIKEMLGTTDARIKQSLEAAGIPTTDTTVKVPSKASKSIVMILLEEKKR